MAAIAAPARAEDAADFIADAKLFYRVVACGGTDPVPATMDAKVVDAHCAEMAKRYASFTQKYITPARAFFADKRPAGLPTSVVYPFGGGDLAGALVTYPDAREITTISLEHAGDPTRLAGLSKARLRQSLSDYRAAVAGLLSLNDSTSENMRKLETGGIPGQLSFHITGMTALGFEPVALKFFMLTPEGTVDYLSRAEVDALQPKKAKKKKDGWVNTDFSEAYTNLELSFRKVGDPSAPVIVHRHIAANLANKAFSGSPLEKYLLGKGKVAAMTKAASYLLWSSAFQNIRSYLLTNMAWMASDSTGIPPKVAKKAGFSQTTYGTFAGAFLAEAPIETSDAMVELWASQPRRKLPFRYGYPDSEKHVHLMITAPREPKK
ncbi:MAG: hypothetical protein AB7O24_22260 [Kofleriaceae bacterium]